MEEIIKYKAFDGKLFDTSEECIIYEKYNDDKRLINILSSSVNELNKTIRFMNRYHNFESPIKKYNPTARRNKMSKKTYYGNTVLFTLNKYCPQEKVEELMAKISNKLNVKCCHEHLSGGNYIRIYQDE